jgi:hypothetical protein
MRELKHRPVNAHQTLVEKFNRELERITRGDTIFENDLPPEDTCALRLAQKLAEVDFSNSSTIQGSLRHRLAERSTHYTTKITGLNRVVIFCQRRAWVSLGVAALLAFFMVFGLLSTQQASATPAYNPLAAQPGMPAASLTVAASHSQSLIPRPVPTPMALYASPVQPAASPARTPKSTEPCLGSQFPIITTTISK